MQLREWNARLHGLVVFRALLGAPVVAKLAAEHGEWTDSHNRTYNLLKAMFPSVYHEEEK